MSDEINILIIGAVISIISTMIGMFGQLIVQAILVNKGKVKIYYKKVYSKSKPNPWGFFNNTNDTVFIVPLWIEFHNTKEKKEIIRNLNLQLFQNRKRVRNMIQLSHFENNEGKESYANNGSYSFILEPTAICRYDLEFVINKSDVGTTFDEVKLSYYDSKDKYHEKPFLKMENTWIEQDQVIDSDWVALK